MTDARFPRFRARLLAALAMIVGLAWAPLMIRAEEAAPAGDTTNPATASREPQWPPKASRVLLSDEQIQRARERCRTDADAKKILEAIVGSAEYWVEQPDQELHDRLPDSRVPRAFNVSAEGCPVHGKEIYCFGFYPWRLDREHPFTITCPIGGETYPSNDFEAYYRSGMADDTLLNGEYADPGRGWVSPSGEKYWLVGYACHWNWQKTWLPAVTALSRAYVLTGDRRYARKAIVMLDRIAEVYPGMDYSRQSRYAELTGGHYYGKIVNAIWETNVLQQLAIDYDLVFDALVGNDPVNLPWRSAEQIRANIDANLLEEGLDGITRGWIRGNFGMHQGAQAYTAIVRQNGPTADLLDSIFTRTGGGISDEGLDYALYNLVFKDGMPYESSPGYCFGWVNSFVELAQALSCADIDLLARPRMRSLFDAPLDMICAGEFTPAIGDAGAIDSTLIGPNATAYMAAFRHYGDARYARVLDRLGALKGAQYASFDDLMADPIRDRARALAAKEAPSVRSRVLDGYGLAILNNPTDTIAASMYYGIRGGHGHFDRLNLELFAHGRRVSPDLGYPDFMNAFVPGIYSWSKNTISHNCLVVDRTIQRGNDGGRVLRFHDSPTVHVADVSAAGACGQADVYRRTLVLVDVSPDASYLVDVFRVRGGAEHVLSLHGQEGDFTLVGAELPSPVTEGTLAGRDVSYGQLYDDPVRGKPGFKGSFGGYTGSGYSHLFNWQRVTPDREVTAEWRFKGDPPGMLRVHIPPAAGQQVTVADAFVSPTRKIPAVLKYVLLDRSAGETGNTFVVVWEPTDGKPFIDRVELAGSPEQALAHDRPVQLTIHRGDSLDYVSVAAETGSDHPIGAGWTSDAAMTVLTDQAGRQTRRFAAGGTHLRNPLSTERIPISPTWTGTIEAVDYRDQIMMVKLDVTSRIPSAAGLKGHTVRIFNDKHSCVYTIAAAHREGLTATFQLVGSDVRTGRVHIGSLDTDAGELTTPTRVLYPYDVAGMHLVTDTLLHVAPIESMSGDRVVPQPDSDLATLAEDFGRDKTANAWIVDFGPGDSIEIEGSLHETLP
jgi:hypothetical protein